MNKVSEQRIKLRIDYSRETDLVFSDNIPAYADWLEKKLALSQHDVSKSVSLEGRDTVYCDCPVSFVDRVENVEYCRCGRIIEQ
jgi:hypothetical protein